MTYDQKPGLASSSSSSSVSKLQLRQLCIAVWWLARNMMFMSDYAKALTQLDFKLGKRDRSQRTVCNLSYNIESS